MSLPSKHNIVALAILQFSDDSWCNVTLHIPHTWCVYSSYKAELKRKFLEYFYIFFYDMYVEMEVRDGNVN